MIYLFSIKENTEFNNKNETKYPTSSQCEIYQLIIKVKK